MILHKKVFEILGLKDVIKMDINRCPLIRYNINEACVHCGSTEYTSNGNKYNSKGMKIPRYICKSCKKTFYNKQKVDGYSLGIRKESDVFKYAIKMFLRIGYEKELRKIVRMKIGNEYEYAYSELKKMKGTNIDYIIDKIRTEMDVTISKRTIIRWKQQIKNNIEYIVIRYSNKKVEEIDWYLFFKEANRGYNLYANSPSPIKCVFDDTIFLLIVLAEYNQKKEMEDDKNII